MLPFAWQSKAKVKYLSLIIYHVTWVGSSRITWLGRFGEIWVHYKFYYWSCYGFLKGLFTLLCSGMHTSIIRGNYPISQRGNGIYCQTIPCEDDHIRQQPPSRRPSSWHSCQGKSILIYKALIMSRLDYCNIIYRNTSNWNRNTDTTK